MCTTMTTQPSSGTAFPSGKPSPAPTGSRAASVDARRSPFAVLGTNPVGLLAVLAFVAFVIAYAVAGAWAAGIAFWAVVLGLPALLVVVSAVADAWRGPRRDEALLTARLAVELATQRPAKLSALHFPLDDPRHASSADYPIKGSVRTGLYWAPGTVLYDKAVAEIWFASEELAEANGFTRAE